MALSFPSSPNVGDITFTGNNNWQWDGYRWNIVTSIGFQGSYGYLGSSGFQGSTGFQGSYGVANVSVGEVQPANPLNGYLWLDSNTGHLSIYYEPESAWIAISAGGPPGVTGSIGYTGSQGDPGGPTGYIGSVGYQGSAGASGASGSGNSIFLSNTTLTATQQGLTYTNGRIWSSGDTVVKQYILQGYTDSQVEKELVLFDNSRIQVFPYTTIYYTADIIGSSFELTKRFAYTIKGVVDNTNGSTTVDLGNIFETIVYSDDNNIGADVRANNALDTLNFYVTGSEDYQINWLIYVTTLEVYHGAH